VDLEILGLVEQTPFIDTHEHLIEESQRLSGALDPDLFPCDDWALLFHQYLGDDLHNAGMTADEAKRFWSSSVSPADKFRLLSPYWDAVRHTGYAQAVRHTIRVLYGEDDITADSVPRIAEKYRAGVRPGFYRDIIRNRANIEHCQVNSLQRIFMETAEPGLLAQDLGFVELARCNQADLEQVEKETGRTIRTLDGWLEAIDAYFARYGPRAVALKNQSAYSRRLDYEAVPKERAAAAFGNLVSPWRAAGTDSAKALHDFLFRYCLGKAAAYGLPVKLHTGYYAGRDAMPLSRLRKNAGDVSRLLQEFPQTKFVLMHIGYPYQDEYIALAKHYRNAYVDMCWAWIINPAASVRFLKEFLMGAPANKLFTFGGDYIVAENIVGHSVIARRGIARALTELVAEGWLKRDEVPALAARIMNGNARATFPDRTQLHRN
jgi:predicted TIM-barrel fold metal-dependent hydrolase